MDQKNLSDLYHLPEIPWSRAALSAAGRIGKSMDPR